MLRDWVLASALNVSVHCREHYLGKRAELKERGVLPGEEREEKTAKAPSANGHAPSSAHAVPPFESLPSTPVLQGMESQMQHSGCENWSFPLAF